MIRWMTNNPAESESDRVRRKYLYRRLAMSPKTKIPARLAMKLVGPDCAYHLYSKHMPAEKEKSDGKP